MDTIATIILLKSGQAETEIIKIQIFQGQLTCLIRIMNIFL